MCLTTFYLFPEKNFFKTLHKTLDEVFYVVLSHNTQIRIAPHECKVSDFRIRHKTSSIKAICAGGIVNLL